MFAYICSSVDAIVQHKMKLICIPILLGKALIIESFLIHIGQFCSAIEHWRLSKGMKKLISSWSATMAWNLYTRMCQTLFCIVCWINSHRDVVLALIKPFCLPILSEWVRDRMLIVIVCLCLIMKIFLFAFFFLKIAIKWIMIMKATKQAQIYVSFVCCAPATDIYDYF